MAPKPGDLLGDVGPIGEDRHLRGHASLVHGDRRHEVSDPPGEPRRVLLDHRRSPPLDFADPLFQMLHPLLQVSGKPAPFILAHRHEAAERLAQPCGDWRPDLLQIFLGLLDLDQVGKPDQHGKIRGARQAQSLFEVIQGVGERFCKVYVNLSRPDPLSVVISDNSNLNPAPQDSCLHQRADALLERSQIAGEPDRDLEEPVVERAGLHDVPARDRGQIAGAKSGHASERHRGESGDRRPISSSMGDRPEAMFDSVALAAVAREIQACQRARFAGVRQPSPDEVIVSLRTGGAVRHLLCSIHPRLARIHFTRPPEQTERLTPFGLLLRSRLIEARLEGAEQPPFERIIRLRLSALEGPVWLVAEIMGRQSNLILTDDRVVIGALKVVTARMSRRRPVLPGRPYAPPPVDRPTPDALTPALVDAMLEGDLPLSRRIAQAVQGVSPMLAHEIAVRAGLDPQMPAQAAAGAASRILEVLREIAHDVARGAFTPVLYAEGDRVVAFAPFPMRAFEGLARIPVETMSEALDRYYREAGDRGSIVTPLDERRAALRRQVAGALDKREAAIREGREALAASGAADRYRVLGELLLTYAHRARRGDSLLRVP